MSLRLDNIPIRTLDRPAPSIEIRKAHDGTVYLNSGIEYRQGLPSLIDYLSLAAERRPGTTFLAERDGALQWRRLTYQDAWRDSGAIATWLIRRGFGPAGRPILILSENSLEHALLTLGALRAGAAVVPVSPTFSFGNDLARLEYAVNLIQPGLVFAKDAARFRTALAHAAAPDRHTATGDEFAQWLRESDEAALAERRKQIGRDTVAKILLTSGSTGRPKGVINTHGNLAAAVQMILEVSERADPGRIPISVNWLPWHHTFGGNAQFNLVIANAGTLYIDDGRPVSGQFKATIENLRELSPTGFSCVPAAYQMLAEALESDADLRQKFFKNMRGLSYGGALLPHPLWERMQRLAVQELGERLPFGTGWGMTETSATGIAVYWNTEHTGLLGLPLPGSRLKLVPSGDRMELRIAGPHVMPCYHRAPELNAAAFDEEGYFRTGDAVRWVDAGRPIEGLAFAGRIAEDFKLLSGTWAQASIIRRDLLDALQPYVSDAVVCAPDKPWLGALVWLNGADSGALRTALRKQLTEFNKQRQGSSSRIDRLLVLLEPPSLENGEITDKRSINQRRVIERRAADVAALYADPVNSSVIVPFDS